MQIFEVFGDIILRDDNTEQRLRSLNTVVENARDKMANMSNMLANVGQGLMDVGSRINNAVTVPIINAVKDSINLASDLGEAYNVVDVTFGKNSDRVKSWSKDLMDSFGLVQLEAINYVGSMGAMLKSSGFSAAASENMSKKLVELTGDMSSFYNLSHEETWEKIRSGISGETEPLKVLGINMSVANLEAYALTQGIKKSWQEMDQAEQTTLRYNYLMSVTSDAQGDFARTSDTFANQLRILSGRFTEMKISLGEKLLPVANDAVGWALKMVEKFQALPEPIQKVIGFFTILAAAVGPLITILGGLAVGAGAFGAALSLISAPIAIVVAAGGVFIAWAASMGAAFIAMAYQAGFVTTAFNQIKAIVMAVVSVVKGDFDNAMTLLTEKFGMSKEEAAKFILKVQSAKDNILKLKTVVVNITELLKAIFTADTEKMMQTLISKFGYSKDEAKKFSDKVLDLRDKIKELASKIKDNAVESLKKFIDKVKDAAKYVVDHRKEIAKIIEKAVEFGTKVVSAGSKAVTAFKKITSPIQTIKEVLIALAIVANKKLGEIQSKAEKVFKAIKTAVGSVKTAFDTLKTAIGNVLTKISNIKFPSVPSWVPGFASGVTNYKGGLALVGEKGPEIVKLPRGADVIPNHAIKPHVSEQLMEPLADTYNKYTRLNQISQNYNINMNNSFSEKIDIDYFFDKFMNVLKRRGLVINNG